jgi:hypothetical protein
MLCKNHFCEVSVFELSLAEMPLAEMSLVIAHAAGELAEGGEESSKSYKGPKAKSLASIWGQFNI